MQVFAMPETALGLFPDIEASYFLYQLPGFYGHHFSPIFIQLTYMLTFIFFICLVFLDIMHDPELSCILIFSIGTLD
jgi:hypothetical protein